MDYFEQIKEASFIDELCKIAGKTGWETVTAPWQPQWVPQYRVVQFGPNNEVVMTPTPPEFVHENKLPANLFSNFSSQE